MRTVVYTAIFGGYDRLKRITPAPGCDHVVFTDDRRMRSRVFDVVVVKPRFDDPVRDARFHKIMGHELLADHDRSLWIDASITLRGVDVAARLDETLADHDVAAHAHPKRDCVYDEAVACIEWDKCDPVAIEAQMAEYRRRGYPANHGLVSTGVLHRRHTDAVADLDEAWWRDVQAHSTRDQLSFPVAAWTVGIDYRSLPNNVSSGDLDGFRLHAHRRRTPSRR